jgi:hypothetical protein
MYALATLGASVEDSGVSRSAAAMDVASVVSKGKLAVLRQVCWTTSAPCSSTVSASIGGPER